MGNSERAIGTQEILANTEGLCPHLHRVAWDTMALLLVRSLHMACRVPHATRPGEEEVMGYFLDIYDCWDVRHWET